MVQPSTHGRTQMFVDAGASTERRTIIMVVQHSICHGVLYFQFQAHSLAWRPSSESVSAVSTNPGHGKRAPSASDPYYAPGFVSGRTSPNSLCGVPTGGSRNCQAETTTLRIMPRRILRVATGSNYRPCHVQRTPLWSHLSTTTGLAHAVVLRAWLQGVKRSPGHP